MLNGKNKVFLSAYRALCDTNKDYHITLNITSMKRTHLKRGKWKRKVNFSHNIKKKKKVSQQYMVL